MFVVFEQFGHGFALISQPFVLFALNNTGDRSMKYKRFLRSLCACVIKLFYAIQQLVKLRIQINRIVLRHMATQLNESLLFMHVPHPISYRNHAVSTSIQNTYMHEQSNIILLSSFCVLFTDYCNFIQIILEIIINHNHILFRLLRCLFP